MLLLAMTINNRSFAEEAPQPISEPYLADVYPTYPATTPATGERAKLIERGEYLAKMGDCIACHTDMKGGTPPYAGRLPIETPFGTFYSPNITPDKETGIGNWSEEDFIRALKEGRDPKGRNYFPVFPYVYFSKMSDDDARALYAYFMSIPPVKLENKSLPFPFNIPGARMSLWGWNMLFFFPQDNEFVYNNEQSPSWNRGKYIVDTLGHCSMCHTPLNVFGAPKNRYYLTGGFIDGYWAPNITKYGLHTASHYEVADVFGKGNLINRAGPVAGPMAEVNHNSLSHLTDDDRLAIATYLKTVVSEEPLGVPASEAQPTLKRGKQVYINSCIICHQDGKMSAPLNGDGANWYRRLKSSGLTGLYRHAINGYNSMPVKGACVTCSDNDIIAATDYILNNSLSRSQWLDLSTGRAAKFPSNGRDIYNESCAICHNDGKNGAPRIGDKEAWKPLIAKNIDTLLEDTMKGGVHPANGGCKLCTTGEVLEAIKYMVSRSKTEGNYSLW
ncbi:c-type cytochrome [Legionella sp. CNM-4043-24]|uniref:c-type cytochrome n=1 Tax=Legionella sp. CNM-4043-24 TaxID=3421646 RepID=UPI00403AD7F9